MPQFSVWSPKAKSVSVALGDRQIPMEPRPFGWRTCPVPEGAPEYALAIGGGVPLPDPRSHWQPYGVHGPSRLVDHSSFQWSDDGWRAPCLSSGIVYELHIGTFTEEGTFDSAISRIPHLASL